MPETQITIAELSAIVEAALAAAGASAANAASVARALTAAEVDGQRGHGLSRLASYVTQLSAGKVRGDAVPSLARVRAASLSVDAAHGFAYPAFDLAIRELPAVAGAHGIAAAAITRSHHFGVAGHHVERLARSGLIGIVLGNTPHAMAAWGGRRAVLGTNPLAFAAPAAEGPPLVIDLALSTVARGRIVAAAQKGEPIPSGWALDATGAPTTDAKAALKGTLLPLGGAKGAALALMVELLATGLTGANLAADAASFLDDKGGPPGVGQVLIAIDPAGFAGADVFAGRFSALAGMIAADGARLPGSRRLALRERAQRDGLSVDTTLLAEARRLAGL